MLIDTIDKGSVPCSGSNNNFKASFYGVCLSDTLFWFVIENKFCAMYVDWDPPCLSLVNVLLVRDLNRTPIVMAKHGGSWVHFSGISTCGRTSWETVSHPQRQPLPTPYNSLPVYIITNKRLQPLTTALYNSMVLSFSLLKNQRRLIKQRSFLCALHR